jgi:hypothetical protein
MNTLTLWDFFFGGGPLTDEQWQAIDRSEELSRLHVELPDRVPREFWTAIREDFVTSLQEMLNVTIGDILVAAWNSYQGLKECCDPAKHPAGKIVHYPIAQHSIHSVQKPDIDLMVGNQVVATLAFDVDLCLEFDLAVLAIRDGKIQEIQTGSCTGKGTLSYGAAKLAEVSTRSVSLPGRLTFGAGVPQSGTRPDAGLRVRHPVRRASREGRPKPIPTVTAAKQERAVRR